MSMPSVRPAVNPQREADIELLKLAHQRVRALQDLLVRYDNNLSHELASPSRKIDEALAWLLFRREMES